MNLIGCLDRATGGTYVLDGIDITKQRLSELANLRNRKIGFIFQGFNLLPRMDALDNVMLPMVYAGVAARVRQQRAVWRLSRWGWAIAFTIGQASFPAVNNSAWLSRAHWSMRPV